MNAAAISNFCKICGANQCFHEKVLSKKSGEASEKTIAKIVNSIKKYLNPFQIPISDSKIPLLKTVSGHVVDKRALKIKF